MKTLTAWIQELGDERVADLIGVTVRTAASYRRLERTPRPEVAARIIKASEGQVDWESIYRPAAEQAAA